MTSLFFNPAEFLPCLLDVLSALDYGKKNLPPTQSCSTCWSGAARILLCLPPALKPWQGQQLLQLSTGDSTAGTVERFGGAEVTPASTRAAPQGQQRWDHLEFSWSLGSLGSLGPLMVLGTLWITWILMVLGITWTSHGPWDSWDHLDLGSLGSLGSLVVPGIFGITPCLDGEVSGGVHITPVSCWEV